MEKLNMDSHERDVLMLQMNEKMILTVPKPLLHAVGKVYYRSMSKSAKRRMEKKPAYIHPFDWQMTCAVNIFRYFRRSFINN